MKDFSKLIAAGFAVFAVLTVAGFAFLRWDFNRGYSMNPSAFREQVDGLERGMSKEEVKSIISGFTDIKESHDKIIFILRANEYDGVILPRINQYINVEFDSGGEMISAYSSDG